MGKRIAVAAATALLFLGLAGCGKEEETTEYVKPDVFAGIDESEITFNSDGSIFEVACQDFSEVKYDYGELLDYVKDEINDFNAANGANNVSFIDFYKANGLVKVAIQYTDIDTYNAFNGVNLELSAYDADRCDELVKEAVKAELPQVVAAAATEEIDLSRLSDEELLEAGYTREDIENGNFSLQEDVAVTDETTGEVTVIPEIATFTDAVNGGYVESDDISNDLMMLVIDVPTIVHFENGRILYYSNAEYAYGNIRCLGHGEAVVVFEYNYAN